MAGAVRASRRRCSSARTVFWRRGPSGSGRAIGMSVKGQRLIALFLLGLLLLNYPLFALFAGPMHVLGIPLVHLYVFVAWALTIALMALVVERRTD
jgi:hypothetical protein